VFYIGGRDKYYRPSVIMDGAVINQLNDETPGGLDCMIFGDLWYFFYQYLKSTMLVPGQVENWIFICNLNKCSLASLPRKQLESFGNMCADNLMYFMAKAYYLNITWG
jgi:hypothetical protein